MQRDEIAEQVVALAGSVSNEKAEKMRELVRDARIEGVDRLFHIVDAVRCSHLDEVKRLDELTERVSKAETTIKAAWDNDAKGHAWNEERISALERGRLAAPFGQIPQHAFERADENTGEGSTVGAAERDSFITGGRAPDPSPASPASVPEWVPSVDEIQQFIDDGREGDLRALIASRAPRASTVSVEEMAEKLLRAYRDHYGLGPSKLNELTSVGRNEWLAVARAAIAAMPAPDAPRYVVPSIVRRAIFWNGNNDPRGLDDVIQKAREAIVALDVAVDVAAPDAPKPASERDVVLEMPETDSGPLGRAQLEALHRLLAPVLDAAGFAPGQETAQKAIARLLGQWRSGLEPRVQPASEAGKPPTIEEMAQAERAASLKACGSWHRGTDAGYAAMRALCLASRAPSIEDVVDALLRVTSYKSSYETGASGLVYRADVEQVMRALFDRSGK